MDSKIIIYILIVALLAVTITGSACAFEIMGHSGGADTERGISIEEIEFNIPDGYEKINDKSIVNMTNSSGNISYVVNQETYKNSDGEEIIISIVDYNDFDVDADTLYRICEGTEAKTMMGYPGYINKMENYTQFVYAFNHKAVGITAPNEKVINQILVVEDS
ncbi:MAG: hypothetical protein BZ138_03110 [Methanosphaera sp. rholeuAM270]|nr:MAG: hypothetical protein BZ138_03110 [Methanosphaera sp. rholeuAM270]